MWWAALVGCGAVGSWLPIDVEGGLLRVTAPFDGTDVDCTLDTGATCAALHTDLGFITGTATVALGDQELEVSLLSHQLVDPVLEALGVDCLLGWNAFEQRALTIDYAGEQIRITGRRPKERSLDLPLDLGEPVTVPLELTGLVPVAEVRFQDQVALAVVDTGAQVAVLAPELFSALADPPETVSAEASTPDGIVEVGFGTLSEVALGDLVHEGVDFATYDSIQLRAIADELGTEIPG